MVRYAAGGQALRTAGRHRSYEMQGERARHNRVKTRITLSMQAQIDSKKLPCENYSDGMAVRVDAETVFEPDAMVRMRPSRARRCYTYPRPPHCRRNTLADDATCRCVQEVQPLLQHNPSLVHYLIINSIDANAVHHRCNEQGRIESRSHNGGVIDFDPPGLSLDLDQLFLDLD